VTSRKTPPGVNPAALRERESELGFDRVGTLTVLSLGGDNGQAQLLANGPRKESTDRMRLPTGAFITSLAVAPPGCFSKSRTLAALLPSRAAVAFFAALGAFLAGLAFVVALAFFGTPVRARLAPVAFGWFSGPRQRGSGRFRWLLRSRS
jgi:hypothetical protein